MIIEQAVPHPSQADEHVGQIEQRITEQVGLICRRVAQGEDAAGAREVLANLLATLKSMQDYHAAALQPAGAE
jgi:hypothetical protein